MFTGRPATDAERAGDLTTLVGARCHVRLSPGMNRSGKSYTREDRLFCDSVRQFVPFLKGHIRPKGAHMAPTLERHAPASFAVPRAAVRALLNQQAAAVTIGAYLVLIEFAKSRFYAAENHPRRRRPTPPQRHGKRINRRAARFVTHHPPRRR